MGLQTLEYLEDKLKQFDGDFIKLRDLCELDTFINNAPGTEQELFDDLEWLALHQYDEFPEEVEIIIDDFAEGKVCKSPSGERLPCPSKLFGTEGEERGAKHRLCKPGRRMCGTRCIAQNLNCKYDESLSTLESQKFSVKEASGLTNSMPKELRDKFAKKFPAVFEDERKEGFFWHLMYSSHTTKDGSTLVPKDVVNRFSQKRDAEGFMKEFQTAMGKTPRAGNNYFTFTDYSYKHARAREAKMTLPAGLEKAFKDDLRNPDMNTKRVFSIGGAEYNEENIEKVRDQQRNLAKEVAASLKIDEQKTIAMYHADQRESEMPKFRFKQAYKAAEAIENDDSRETALRVLNNIRTNPVGFYRPSEITTRMFSANHLQGLKSTVRAALVPEMGEMDLISCHTAIIADLRQDPTLKKVMQDKIEKDVSLWDKFRDDFQAAGYPWDKKTKAAVKEQFYALCFGGTKPGAARRLTFMSRDVPGMEYVGEKKFKDTLFNNETFSTIEKIGTEWRKELIEKGYGVNAFGQKFTVTSQKKARSVQSAICQSYETALVTAAAYPDAKRGEKKSDFPWDVVYFAHDGVGVVPKKGLSFDDILPQMKARLKRKTKEMGLELSGLEIKPGDKAALEDMGLTDEEIRKLERGEDI